MPEFSYKACVACIGMVIKQASKNGGLALCARNFKKRLNG